MSDVLSSASLLFTLIGLLYSVWYSEITASIEVEVKPHALDRVPDYRRVRNTYRAKLVPLTMASLALAAVFAPDSVKILVDSLRLLSASGASVVPQYNSVAASMVLVTTGAVFLAGHLIIMCWKMRRLLAQLKSAP